MQRFTRLFLDLDATTSTTEKLETLRAYFTVAPAADAAWALALLTGNSPKRAASTTALQSLAVETTGCPPWLLSECHAAVGDLSETIALLLPDPPSASDEPLHRVMEDRVLPLIGASEDTRRSVILAAWRAFDADQRLVYHKLVRGGFRLGVQKRLVTRALAAAFHVPPEAMAHRLTGPIRPDAASFAALTRPDGPADNASRPYPFFLAHPLDTAPDQLGPVTDWQAEWKWDGIRSQLIRRAGVTALWSRGEEPIAAQFPEIIAAAARLPAGTVLDGEILLWRDHAPRPFAELQTRLNRKVAPIHQPGLFEDTRAVLLAYDLLERNGVDTRARPLRERRQALNDLIGHADDETIRLSPVLESNDWPGLARLQQSARHQGAEGLMLKHLDSPYGIGRTRDATNPGWFKWKVDPYTADAVLVSAQPASGRRANLYTDYTFAAWDRSTDDQRLVTFAKAYSGLDQSEIEELDRWIRANTVSKQGPFRQVRPVQVFELGFEGIQLSGRHKSGLAVRFPRILRWRRDKPAAEADTLETLRALLRSSDP